MNTLNKKSLGLSVLLWSLLTSASHQTYGMEKDNIETSCTAHHDACVKEFCDKVKDGVLQNFALPQEKTQAYKQLVMLQQEAYKQLADTQCDELYIFAGTKAAAYFLETEDDIVKHFLVFLPDSSGILLHMILSRLQENELSIADRMGYKNDEPKSFMREIECLKSMICNDPSATAYNKTDPEKFKTIISMLNVKPVEGGTDCAASTISLKTPYKLSEINDTISSVLKTTFKPSEEIVVPLFVIAKANISVPEPIVLRSKKLLEKQGMNTNAINPEDTIFYCSYPLMFLTEGGVTAKEVIDTAKKAFDSLQ